MIASENFFRRTNQPSLHGKPISGRTNGPLSMSVNGTKPASSLAPSAHWNLDADPLIYELSQKSSHTIA